MINSQVNIEKQLLNNLEQISKNPENYAALYIHSSKLKPKHRHPKFLKILEKFFDSVVGLSGGALFPLSNGDFIILGNNFSQKTINEAIDKLKQGLSNDPIIHSKNPEDFAEIYQFPEQFSDLCNLILELLKNQDKSSKSNKADSNEINTGDLDRVINTLQQIDISELVKRQSVVEVKGANKFQVHYQEFFIAVKDLNLLFHNLDIQKNRWLYFYILQHLDKRILQAFFAAKLKQWPDTIGINLTLQSITSPEFTAFTKEFLQQQHKCVVEVQLTDVFNNLPLYLQAKEILHKNGQKILIDGITTASLKLLNLQTLAPDMIKIFWEPLMEYEKDNSEIQSVLALLKSDNVILAKCDTSPALSWGLHNGISSFQGPFMDNLETAVIRRQCPNAAQCDTLMCLKRKRLLSGSEHEKCMNKDILEKLL
ncbi:MAG: EAL domain-containing protein [Alphaproteobacteria bacterium]|nr:EAL domain-containing protein [Alphaproteobacteria bacterium]